MLPFIMAVLPPKALLFDAVASFMVPLPLFGRQHSVVKHPNTPSRSSQRIRMVGQEVDEA